MSETIELSKPTKGVTVSAVADMTGGMAPGNLMETDIDQELFRFNSAWPPAASRALCRWIARTRRWCARAARCWCPAWTDVTKPA